MLPNIATRKNVSVNDLPNPVIEAGEEALVACLHGFPDNYESFQHQIEPFTAAGYRVVCPVMPGFAPPPDPFLTPSSLLIHSVTTLSDRHRLRRPSVTTY